MRLRNGRKSHIACGNSGEEISIDCSLLYLLPSDSKFFDSSFSPNFSPIYVYGHSPKFVSLLHNAWQLLTLNNLLVGLIPSDSIIIGV